MIHRRAGYIHHALDRNHVIVSPCSDIFGASGRSQLDQAEIASPDNLLLKAHLELLDNIQDQIKDAEKWINQALI
jgi:hypothetical protein